MQIKNVTEYNVKILEEYLYLKNLFSWADPEKRTSLELIVFPRTAERMCLQLTKIEVRTILQNRMEKLEQEIRKL